MAPSPTESFGAISSPRAFQVERPFAPALGAFAKAVDKAPNILVAPFISPDNYQHTLVVFIHAGAETDPVRPEMQIAPRRQIAFGPAFLIVPPTRLQPQDDAGRQSRRVRPKVRRQGSEKSLVEKPLR